jgi:hypothetical protein
MFRSRMRRAWIVAALTAGMLLLSAGAAAPASADVCFKAYATVDGKHYGYRMPWCVYRTGWSGVSAEYDRTLPLKTGLGVGVWVPLPV